MKSISIGSVNIPFDDYVTQATAILGIRGAGKTYTAKGIAEQMLAAQVPIIVFDAIGVWRYLKVAGDHGGRAFKLVVAGGHQPDLPLTPESTPQIIRAALRENIPLVIDLYDPKLSKADWRRIVEQAFRIILYENKGMRHIFLEEAAEYVPQMTRGTPGTTFAEVEKLVRMGGNASVGITMINQRSQELNKSVLELCDNLVMMRQKGFNAIAYAEKWADRLSPETSEKIAQKLPKMQAGECWVFTDANEEPTFTQSERIKSFHPDRKKPEHPKNATVADTDEFVQKMAGELTVLIEQAKANDPAELKRKVAELQRKLSQAEQKQPEVKQSDPVEVSVILKEDRAKLEKIAHEIPEFISEMNQLAARVEGIHGEIGWLKKVIEPALLSHSRTAMVRNIWQKPAPVPRAERIYREKSNGHDESISGGLRRMLVALAQRSPLTKRQLGVRAGLSSTSGTFGTYLARLRTNGWVDGQGDNLTITQDGLKSLGHYEPLPEGRDLLAYWLADLGGGGIGRMLEALSEVYPRALSKEELGERAGISPNSGTFGTYLAKLRTLELAEGRGEIRASKEFFE